MTKNKKSKLSSLPVVVIIILLNLTFLFYIKYKNQNLPISSFSLTSFGNLCNLFFALALIFGILLLIFRKNLFLETKIFLPLFFFNQLLIITVYLLSIISLPFKNIYYLGQTGDELLIGGIFTLFIFTYLVLIYLVWLTIFKIKGLISLRALFNASLSMLAIFLFVFFFIVAKEASLNDEQLIKSKNNIGVVLGAAVWSGNKPSPSLAGRVDKAIKLLNQNKITQIYLTGSNAPGELTESEVALKYIKLKGLSTAEIFLEKETTSTNQQIQYIKRKILPNSPENIIVISDSYHLVRVLEIANFHKIKILVSSSELTQSFEKALYNKIRESLALTMFWLFAI